MHASRTTRRGSARRVFRSDQQLWELVGRSDAELAASGRIADTSLHLVVSIWLVKVRISFFRAFGNTPLLLFVPFKHAFDKLDRLPVCVSLNDCAHP